MPLPVAPWIGDTFPTSKSLNLACYTCDGTLNKPNGILFHALRYVTYEALGARSTGTVAFDGSPTGGTRTIIGDAGEDYPAVALLDGAGYYGQSSDGTYWLSGYTFKPAIAGGVGDGITPGGWTIICHFIPVGNGSDQQAVGADIEDNNAFQCAGSRQRPPGSTALDVCPFFLDIFDTQGAKMQPAIIVVDSGSNSTTPTVNTTDSSGETGRWFTIWEGVSNSQAANYGTPATPAPYSGYMTSTTIGTTGAATVNLNGASGIAGPLDFLSNPPMWRNTISSSQNTSTATATQITLSGTQQVDNYGGYSSSSYTVQRPGLYLCHAVTPWTASTSARRNTGISVGSTVYWGPGYQACQGGSTISTKTQIFSLQAGDVIKLWAQQDTGGSLTLSNADETRIFMAWLGLEGTPSTLWTPPDTSFRWQAGTPGNQLPALFQTHIANDIGFLVNRPYLMAYQSSAQSGFSSNSWNTIHMNVLGGIVHSDTGDNYSGWTSGGSNLYSAQQPGWYLAVAEMFGTYPGTPTTAGITAGFNTTTSGGRTPSASPDWYQEMFACSQTYPPGATAVGMYYLETGETIQPQLQGQSYTGSSWGTQVATGVNSHVELVWISE
jgi:hypothetical protein